MHGHGKLAALLKLFQTDAKKICALVRPFRNVFMMQTFRGTPVSGDHGALRITELKSHLCKDVPKPFCRGALGVF